MIDVEYMYFWNSNDEWWTYDENGKVIILPTAPEKAQKSYKYYLAQKQLENSESEIEYIDISDSEDRIVRFGLSLPSRYKENYSRDDDPWWNVHVIVKKPGIEIEQHNESIGHFELEVLADMIEKSTNWSITREENIDFLEPDYGFIINNLHGILKINVKYADSVHIYIEREILDNISAYIRKKLNKAMKK